MEAGDGRCDFRFTTPTLSERTIKPADAAQAGLWAVEVVGADVTLTGTAVNVTADSGLNATAATAKLGSLTISNNVTLATWADMGAVNFRDTTFKAGQTAVTFDVGRGDTYLTDSAGLEGSSAAVVASLVSR